MATTTTTTTTTARTARRKRPAPDTAAAPSPEKLEVLSVSRRTDVPGDPAKLAAFLEALKAGEIRYHNPQRRDQIVTYPTTPEKIAAIGWFSKDYRYLVAIWGDEADERAKLLDKHRHHFSFTINGEAHSLLEPGLRSSLAERFEQLEWLVGKCRSLGQDPDHSIMVHLDPIVTYTDPKSADPSAIHDNLDHVPALCDKLRELGLSRLHISFYQPLPRAHTNTHRAANRVAVVETLTTDEQRELYIRRVQPHLAGIRPQTCSALWLSADASTAEVMHGGCVGSDDICSITRGRAKPRARKPLETDATRTCKCHPYRDVGDKRPYCVHRCAYCSAECQPEGLVVQCPNPHPEGPDFQW